LELEEKKFREERESRDQRSGIRRRVGAETHDQERGNQGNSKRKITAEIAEGPQRSRRVGWVGVVELADRLKERRNPRRRSAG
jgi:hypothetical protein